MLRCADQGVTLFEIPIAQEECNSFFHPQDMNPSTIDVVRARQTGGHCQAEKKGFCRSGSLLVLNSTASIPIGCREEKARQDERSSHQEGGKPVADHLPQKSSNTRIYEIDMN